MSDKRISELDAAASLSGVEITPLVQSGVTKRSTLQSIADWVVQTAASFTQSGSGAVTESVQVALRRLVHTAQYSTQGNYETARDALTGTFGIANLDVRGELKITGTSAGLVIDNDTDADFLDSIVLGAGSATLAKRYIQFRNLDDSIAMFIGANAGNDLIAFSNADQRHYLTATEVSRGGGFQINSGGSGVVTINQEANASTGGMAVYSGGAVPVRWLALDGQGVRIFIGGLSFGAAGGSADAYLVREGADNLAFRSLATPTAAQTVTVYGTFTSSGNYQRAAWKQAKSTLSNVSGASVTATSLIPDGAFLLGVTTRINTALGTGNGTSGYTVGDGSDADLWGVAAAVAVGTATQGADFTAAGAAGVLYTSAQNVVITAVGGNFDGTGVIEVVAHYLICEAT